MPLISIIIPAFNSENFIKDTLESVLLQSISNWELIIVDDGSTDNTLNLIENYANKDSRIRVLSQKNRGVSNARNWGLTRAKGEFIAFLDSDDFYHKDFLQEMSFSLINHKSDVVFCKYAKKDGKGVYKVTPQKMRGNPESSFIHFISINRRAYIPMAFMYRHSFLKKHRLTFTENCTLNEDTEFLLKATYTGKVSYVPKYLYIYVQRPNSASSLRTTYYKTIKDAILACSRVKEFIKANPKRSDYLLYKNYLNHKINSNQIHFQKLLWTHLKAGKYQRIKILLKENKKLLGNKLPVRHPLLKKVYRNPQRWIILSQQESLWRLFKKTKR